VCRTGGGLEQIGEEILVGVAGEEARQFAAEPVSEAAGEFFVLARLEAVQNEGAEQDLAPCVVGALLFAQPRLERLPLGVDLGEPHLDRLSSHVSGPFRFRQRRVISRHRIDARMTAIASTGANN